MNYKEKLKNKLANIAYPLLTLKILFDVNKDSFFL